MLGRKHRRTLVLSLLLSAGALALPAQAAPGRTHDPNAGPSSGSAVQTDLFTRSLIETVKNLWGLLKDAYPGQPPGNDPKRPDNREGSGMCPVGMPHPPGH
jgi:hypothetical protein